MSTAALTGSVVGSNGAAGTIETTVALKSTAGTTCILGGYPGLLLLSSTGAALPTTVVRKGTYTFTSMAPATVTLAPGQSTYFNIGYSDVPVGSETNCPTSASLEVTPPNATTIWSSPPPWRRAGEGPWWCRRCSLATGSDSQTTGAAQRPDPTPVGSTSSRPRTPPARMRSRAGPNSSRPTSSSTISSRRAAGQSVAISSQTRRRSSIGVQHGVDAEQGGVAHDEGIDRGLEVVPAGEPAGGHRGPVAQGPQHRGQGGPAHAVHRPGPPLGAQGALRSATRSSRSMTSEAPRPIR